MPLIRPPNTVSAIDSAFAKARTGDRDAFADWMGSAELPIRLSLQRFVQAVDVEGVVQETLLRMWILSQDRGRELEGENASLRFALGVARNLARAEARRMGRERLLPPEDLPEPAVDPEPVSDPGLRRAIMECVAKLAAKPLEALRARMRLSALMPDRDIAARAGMKLNTFLQNIVRARKHVADCLERKGIALEEAIS
jgi:DNA-directed RNA polymerase specialized sigma24 family protein